jgi:hypothetical protein
MKLAVAVCAAAVAVAACSHAPAKMPTVAGPPRVLTPADKLVGLLPDGAQVVVELDLARLRDNAVIGAVVRRALAEIAVSTDVQLPMKLPTTPLVDTSYVVLAAYGVGTSDAATITLLATPHDVAGSHHVMDGVVAYGPEAWLAQLDARAAIAERTPIGPSEEMLRLRERAQPTGSTGAAIRISARLSFDARIALARQTGVEIAPAQLSAWADVADDLAVVVDADAGGESPAKLAGEVRGVLGELGESPALRALGLPGALDGARQTRQGSWIRTVVTVGPAHLKRVVARATALLGPIAAGSAAGSAS